MNDLVNHPPHYTRHPSGVECIEITEHFGFNVGNAIKYLWREGHKGNSQEDLRKAAWYVDREILRRTREAWADFPHDERYQISSAGRVRNAATGWLRSLVRIKNGYLTFSVVRNGTYRTYYVHRAVATTFFGSIPKGMHVCHRDGDRGNNHVTNLRIDTPRGNAADRRRHGTHFMGDQNPAAVLTAETVVEIRSRGDGTEKALAREFGVSRATIGRIRRGEAWQDQRTALEIGINLWLDAEPEGDVRAAVESLWRADEKGNAVEDLRKAAWYVQREIERRAATSVDDGGAP